MRMQKKYPGLEKEMNLKIRWELFDQDYIHKLNDKEKEWLNNFNEEYISTNFKHKGKRLHKKKQIKECYTANNSRNRCVYSRAKAKGEVFDVFAGNDEKNTGLYENELIDLIDYKKENIFILYIYINILYYSHLFEK